MAITTDQKKAFSIKQFIMLFNNSRARKFMSKMELEIVSQAIANKETDLLKKLYEVLLQEHKADEQIMREYTATQSQVLDKFDLKAAALERGLLREINHEKIAPAEKAERDEAENLLKLLNI